MKIIRDQTTVVLEGHDEHRAIGLAVRLAQEAIEVALRDGKVSPELVRAGAFPDLHDLTHMATELAKLEGV